ncbi:sirohydrochlorin chelatase [Gordonia sp. Z-3]|uniref:Sirohydrochlorin chelatase n=1 Tax=Gordonia tangerina TaxID=2911060 RepID=A0ABS9DFR7_9ACTN|nr:MULTISPECIES: sirohydrochlorin chelatase [Gordonia]MAU84247.1 cobalamin biosynthesis protein CbiX [Gordonia sp. (in: high G+C Gram-positive bacteria)]MCF3937952.1 sirohydrochlorin chelatase [Gordonia tangerina]MED5800924.1 sirohydrochlorin chelatase [Gordonia sp. Z-3]
MNPTLLLVAHGSRDPRFAATASRIRDAVGRVMPGVDTELAYLDLDAPLVGTALEEVTGDCVVVPLLFAAGYHSKIDLPTIIADHTGRGRAVTQTDVIGSSPLAQALAYRLVEAGVTDPVADRVGVILTAVGSSDAAADRHVRRRAIELSTLLNRPVEVVFATKLGARDHRLRTAIRRLRSAGAERIAVSPYFLSAGLLTERVEAAVDRHTSDAVVAGPLGAHRDVIEAVCRQYRAVATRDSTQESLSAATFVARA